MAKMKNLIDRDKLIEYFNKRIEEHSMHVEKGRDVTSGSASLAAKSKHAIDELRLTVDAINQIPIETPQEDKIASEG